jgi:hypothetical protein
MTLELYQSLHFPSRTANGAWSRLQEPPGQNWRADDHQPRHAVTLHRLAYEPDPRRDSKGVLFERSPRRVDGDDDGVLTNHRGIDGGGIMTVPRHLREQRVLHGDVISAPREGGDLVAARPGDRDGEGAGALRGTYQEQAERGRVSHMGVVSGNEPRATGTRFEVG